LSIPAGVWNTLCGALPSRGSKVVPFKQTAPTSVFEKLSMRVYSSPKPTQPDNKTKGELNLRPRKSIESNCLFI